MSLVRYLGLAIVTIWLVGAVAFALSDVIVLLDPLSRQEHGICSEEMYPGSGFHQVSDRKCLPQLAMRGALDAVMVGLPMLIGVALVPRRRRAGRWR
jgi:hypothetical protein